MLDKTIPDQTRTCQTRPDQTKPNQTKLVQSRPYQTRSDNGQAKQNLIWSDHIELTDLFSHARPGQTKLKIGKVAKELS